MCPFVLLTILFGIFIFLLELTVAVTVKFHPSQLNKTLPEGDRKMLSVVIEDTNFKEYTYEVISENLDIVDVKNQTYFFSEDNSTLNISFVVTGNFMGITKLRVVEKNNNSNTILSTFLQIKISKIEQDITKAFTTCVIILMSFSYINMGCALDLGAVTSVLKKPIAPCVGFFCQYGFMPLIAYCLARLLFSDVGLQLGLFAYACSPGGGASNMWTVLLKGNLNLSLTLTFVTNLAALGMVPLWFVTLGRTLFSEIKTAVPYARMFEILGMMLITLAIGVAFQKYIPKVAKFCRRILAPAFVIMILVIIVFGIYANFYMFKLFTWRIVIAATINVWLGFIFGAVVSKIFTFSKEDIVAIAIETGIQNTGIAFVLLQYSLPVPEKDLAAVVPIAASIMTPIPLIIMYCAQIVQSRFCRKSCKEQNYILSNDDREKGYLPTPSSADPIISASPNGSIH